MRGLQALQRVLPQQLWPEQWLLRYADRPTYDVQTLFPQTGHDYGWVNMAEAPTFLLMQVGTETEGSLMAPAERTGATALRPTFGLIGRSGVMSLVDSLVWINLFPLSFLDAGIL